MVECKVDVCFKNGVILTIPGDNDDVARNIYLDAIATMIDKSFYKVDNTTDGLCINGADVSYVKFF